MKLNSPKTYKVVRFTLETGSFKQLEAQKATGVSFGLVNRVTNWMKSRKFVAKEPGGYNVIAPAALAQTFSLFRQMGDLRTSEFMVDINPQKLESIIKEHGAAYCLSSALSYYDDYFRDPSIHVYGSKKLEKTLNNLPSGRTRIDVYRDDLQENADIISAKGIRKTTKIRTIIDLLCSERAYAADRLIKKTWS